MPAKCKATNPASSASRTRDGRFPKGRSGNPKGRPRQAKRFAGILERTLNETIMVTENGRRRNITKAEMLFKQLVNKSASGDARSIQLLLQQIRAMEHDLAGSLPLADQVNEEQMLMLDRLTVAERCELRRLVAKAQGDPPPDMTAPPAVVAPTVPAQGDKSDE